jgi:hypothetical protein
MNTELQRIYDCYESSSEYDHETELARTAQQTVETLKSCEVSVYNTTTLIEKLYACADNTPEKHDDLGNSVRKALEFLFSSGNEVSNVNDIAQVIYEKINEEKSSEDIVDFAINVLTAAKGAKKDSSYAVALMNAYGEGEYDDDLDVHNLREAVEQTLKSAGRFRQAYVCKLIDAYLSESDEQEPIFDVRTSVCDTLSVLNNRRAPIKAAIDLVAEYQSESEEEETSVTLSNAVCRSLDYIASTGIDPEDFILRLRDAKEKFEDDSWNAESLCSVLIGQPSGYVSPWCRALNT